ncbi:hypothetical protein ACTPD5_21155, partial [Clostridioides difficile]|uniref:hypothetical protein n=1 Tax=Clostridioides difficile TaxID=1496 RepID=UPI003F8D208B
NFKGFILSNDVSKMCFLSSSVTTYLSSTIRACSWIGIIVLLLLPIFLKQDSSYNFKELKNILGEVKS